MKSYEPIIADLANGWLKTYNLDYKLEQEPLNSEIDKALIDYSTKSGGNGVNRPDVKLLLQDSNLDYYPVVIEYKGYKNKLIKLDFNGNVQNLKTDNTPHYSNIKSYAVNGAVHYANALLQHTGYTDIISIGMTGFKNSEGNLEYSIGVYYVSKDNLGIGQKVGDFTDFSFLKKENFDNFISHVKSLSLSTEEIQKIQEKREKEIDFSLSKLNNDIYINERGLSAKDTVNLVAASIISTLGVPGKIAPLEKNELKSSQEKGNTDGEVILRKIKGFLDEKSLPEEKKNLIINSLSNTLINGNVNKVIDGETQLKRVFSKIVDELGYYYKIGLTTDFTGRLFNEMYSWLGFSQDDKNDVVLTPSYVANLMVKLARVNKDSYVWDFAAGSAGLLVAAMNEMLNDAKENIKSPDELALKEVEIKAKQLLGLEILPEIYMLAILNMILMGDGSSNIINEDSLLNFNGNYSYPKKNQKFPATAFLLNPPYSAEGNGMNFVLKALNLMEKGYASIIIQDTAGNGRATQINRNILKKHTLLASIKMPSDLFLGKSSVQTAIYVFKVNEAHEAKFPVKFINFKNDGYKRTNRRKGKGVTNLKDIDRAAKRYEEVVNLVKYGSSQLDILDETEYIEDTIELTGENFGRDWNFDQHIKYQKIPHYSEQYQGLSDYLMWEVKKQHLSNDISNVSESIKELERQFEEKGGHWQDYRIGDIFEKLTSRYKGKGKKNEVVSKVRTEEFNVPVVYAKYGDNGIMYWAREGDFETHSNIISIIYNGAVAAGLVYAQYEETGILAESYFIKYKEKEVSFRVNLFFKQVLEIVLYKKYSRDFLATWKNKVENDIVLLPTINGIIDTDYMERYIKTLEKDIYNNLKSEYELKLSALKSVVERK